ncbi:MAG: CdaR family protein [Acidobacteriota bacterium]
MPFIKEKLLENWALKIVAILLALILWLFIQGDPGSVTTVAANVEVNIPSGMEISSELPSTVQVMIRGTSQSLKCKIDLQNAEEGEKRIVLNEDHIESSQGRVPEVIKVTPPQVNLVLEKTIRKENIPITVPVQGEVADGFEVYEKILTPATVTIEGPRSVVEPMDEVSTEVVDLNGLNTETKLTASLNLKERSVRSSVSGPIQVDIKIGLRRKMYVVKDVSIDLGGKDDYLASPPKIDIQLMSPETYKPVLIPDSFQLTVDSKIFENADSPVEVQPNIVFRESYLSEVVKIRGTDPPVVTIRRKDETTSKKQ